MEILLQNTIQGLVPVFDDDYDNKRRLTLGEFYKVKIVKARNLGLHKKYFALIKCAWEYLSETQAHFFKDNIDLFRETVQVAAGYCTLFYSIDRKEWLEKPISISFEKMDEFEFRTLYEKVKDVIFIVYLSHISIEEFNYNLSRF